MTAESADTCSDCGHVHTPHGCTGDPTGRRMSAAELAPTPQGLVLFEVYEKDGALLLVTSDSTLIEAEPGDRVVRRPWATASGAEEVRRG